jgi:hypothetical protein
MRDNYRFILLARASYFRSVSKAISIPEDLGHRRDWRTCCVEKILAKNSRLRWASYPYGLPPEILQ